MLLREIRNRAFVNDPLEAEGDGVGGGGGFAVVFGCSAPLRKSCSNLQFPCPV